jgi:hypothetical protein
VSVRQWKEVQEVLIAIAEHSTRDHRPRSADEFHRELRNEQIPADAMHMKLRRLSASGPLD